MGLLAQQFVSSLQKMSKWTNNEHTNLRSYMMGAMLLALEWATLMTIAKMAHCSVETAPKSFRRSTKSGILRKQDNNMRKLSLAKLEGSLSRQKSAS